MNRSEFYNNYVCITCPTSTDQVWFRCRANLKLADFNIVGRIGDGSFSTVILGQHRESGEKYAIKCVNKHLIMRNKMVEYIKNERTILDQLEHDGIVKLLFTFQDADSLCKCLACRHDIVACTHYQGWGCYCLAHGLRCIAAWACPASAPWHASCMGMPV